MPLVLRFCSALRPTSRSSGGGNGGTGNGLTVGIADDQAKDFDFEKTEMKYDSTGMFHWCPARSLEDCILVSYLACTEHQAKHSSTVTCMYVTMYIYCRHNDEIIRYYLINASVKSYTDYRTHFLSVAGP